VRRQTRAICDSEDVRASAFLSTLEDIGVREFLPNMVSMLGGMIERGDYGFQGWATIDTHGAAATHIAQLCRENGIDAALPRLVSGYFRKAMAAGHGGDELARLYEFMSARASA
jgi:hypothetical protein